MIKKRFVNRVVADDYDNNPYVRGVAIGGLGGAAGAGLGYTLAKNTDIGKGLIQKTKAFKEAMEYQRNPFKDYTPSSSWDELFAKMGKTSDNLDKLNKQVGRYNKLRTGVMTAVPAAAIGGGLGYWQYNKTKNQNQVTAADNDTDWGKAAAIGVGTAAGYGTSLHTDFGRELLFKAKPFKDAAEAAAGIRQFTPEELVKNYKRMEALGDLRKTALIGAGAAAGAGLYYGGKKLYNRNNNITSADKDTYDDNHIDRMVKNGAIGGAVTGALAGATGSAMIPALGLAGAAAGGAAGYGAGGAGKLAGIKNGKLFGSGAGSLVGHIAGTKLGKWAFGRHLARDMAIGAAAGTTMGALGGALAGKQKEANPENSDTGAMIKGPLKYGATVGTAAGAVGGGILGHNLPKLGKLARYGGIPLAGAAIGAGLGAAGGELVGLHQVPANAIGRFITKDRGQNVNNTVTSAENEQVNQYERMARNSAIGGAIVGAGAGLLGGYKKAGLLKQKMGLGGALAHMAGGAGAGAASGGLSGLIAGHYKTKNPDSSDAGSIIKSGALTLGAVGALSGGISGAALGGKFGGAGGALAGGLGGAILGGTGGAAGGAVSGALHVPTNMLGDWVYRKSNNVTSAEIPLIHVIALSKEDKRNAGIATGATLGLGAGGYLGYKGLSGLAESNALKDVEKAKNTYGDIWAGRKAGLKGLFTKGVKSKEAYNQALLENKTARLLAKNAEKIGKWGKIGTGLGAVGLGTTGAYAGYKVTSSEVPLIHIVAVNIVDMAAKKAYVPGKMTKTWGNISSNVGNWTPDVHISHSVARKQIPEAELIGAMHSAATRQHQNYLAKNLGNSNATATADKLYNKVLEYSKKSDAFDDIDRQLYNKGRDFAPNVYKKPAKDATVADVPKVAKVQLKSDPRGLADFATQRENKRAVDQSIRRQNKKRNKNGGAKTLQQSYKSKKAPDILDNSIKEAPTNTTPAVTNVQKVEPVKLDTADTRSWVRKHPYKTAAIAGAGVGAAGTGAYLYNKNRDR